MDPVLENVAPLPALGEEQFAAIERQCWRLPRAQELLARSGVPRNAFLGIVCEDATREDHRRCISYIVWSRVVSRNDGKKLGWGALLILGVTIAISLYHKSGPVLWGNGFIALTVFVVLASLARVALQNNVIQQLASDRTKPGKNPTILLLANRDGIYYATGDSVTKISWMRTRSVHVIEGDLFVHGGGSGRNWLYIPRRAFVSENDSQLLAEALQQLAETRGNPDTLPTNARPTFPPPSLQS